uniref:Membrane protein BRI3 n=1 Tax=Syphacia muris TaxID=451379 RepID=A0A0N5APP9_9BILA
MERSAQNSQTGKNSTESDDQQVLSTAATSTAVENDPVTVAASVDVDAVAATSLTTSSQCSVLAASTTPVTSSEQATLSSPYSQPPPSYQDALSYPTSSYHSIRMSSTFPKPDLAPMPPYSTLPLVTEQSSIAAPANPPVIVTVSGVPVENCPFCRVGSVVTEFDLCLLVCLILLAIFTFPVGLLFLCCIPCTIHKRCNSCQRTVRILEVSNLV